MTLDIIQCVLKLQIIDKPVKNLFFEHPRLKAESAIIDNEIYLLLRIQVINREKDDTYRTILNLKNFNKNCTTEYLKIESVKNSIIILKPGMLLSPVDTKDAFYSVLIFSGHRKYLQFIWKGKTY